MAAVRQKQEAEGQRQQKNNGVYVFIFFAKAVFNPIYGKRDANTNSGCGLRNSSHGHCLGYGDVATGRTRAKPLASGVGKGVC